MIKKRGGRYGKKGFELTINTIILIVLGILLLTGLLYLLFNQEKFFQDSLEEVSEKSNVDLIISNCNSLVDRESYFSYCCEKKDIVTDDEEFSLTCFEIKQESFGERVRGLDCSETEC